MNVAGLLAWRAELLEESVTGLVVSGRRLVDLQDEIDLGAVPPDWVGGDAEAARHNHGLLVGELVDLVAEVSAASRALAQAADSIARARGVLDDALQVAAHSGFMVDSRSNAVRDVRPPSEDPHQRADRDRLRTEIADHVEQSLRTARHADLEVAVVLDQLLRGTFDVGARRLQDAVTAGADLATRPIRLPPPVSAGPGDQFAWWQGLTGEEQQRVVDDFPGWVGNVDGVPAWARDAANRNRLPDLRAALVAEVVRLSRRPFGLREGRIDGLLKKISGLDRVLAALRRPGTRQLLALDANSRELHVVLAQGDVDTADNVTVLTHGFTSSVDDTLLRADDEMTHLRDRADALDPATTHATVLWMGYDAPQIDGLLADPFGSESVLSDDLARAAAPGLAAYLNGIDASRGEDPHLTNAGHSYGGLTAGLSAQDSTGLDELVVLGAPSLGVDDVGDLDVPAGHLYSVEADHDLVADSGFFGPDPTHLEGVRQLDTAAHDDLGLGEVTGHTSYFTDASTSQHNLAAVATGQHDLLIDTTREPEVTDELRHLLQHGQDLVGEVDATLAGLGDRMRDEALDLLPRRWR